MTAKNRIVFAAGIVLFLLPFKIGGYHLFQLTHAATYAIALVGLNILTGYNGQLSIGHGAIYAIGSYAAAILIDQAGFSYWTAIPAAAFVCLIFGFLFGLPALRLEGHYLALATFALAVATPQLLKWKRIEHWSGGVQGIVLMPPKIPPAIAQYKDELLYCIVLAVTVLMFLIARNLLKGRIGLALIAVRDNPTAAAAMGINLTIIKSGAFAISAMYTGIAGALATALVQFVSPDSFTVFLSITLLVGLVVGGIGRLSGAIWGGLFIQFIPNLTEMISDSAPWAIYGVILIAIIILMPSGIAGFLETLNRTFSKRIFTTQKNQGGKS